MERRNTSSSALDRPNVSHIGLCLNTVTVLEFNTRRHWEPEHRASNFASTSSAERKDAIDILSGILQKTTSFFRKQTAYAEKIFRASYSGAGTLFQQGGHAWCVTQPFPAGGEGAL